MLEELRIASLGVIDEAELELGPGLTVVTGETGAGKTMVVTALGLLLGERADSGLVRHGAERSRVEGRVQAPEGSTVGGRAREAGAELDDGSLIVARTVSAGGRSRANVGGAAVPVGVMSELTAELIVVHGQSDQQQLLAPSAQRECLDRFAGAALEQALDRYRQTYARLESVRSELTELSTKARERAQEADHLRFGLAEIEAVDPQPAEDDDLEVEEQRLGNVDALLRGAEEARFVLSGDESAAEGVDALSLVAAARRSIEAQRDHDPGLGDLLDRLASASYALTDVAADITSYASALDTDPGRLAAVSERRAALHGLTRKYGEGLAEVLAWSQRAASRLGELDNDDERIDSLRDERESLEVALGEEAAELSTLRGAAAGELATQVSAELHGLAMPHADFEVAVSPLPEPGKDGCDEVGFLLASHDGAEPRPVQRSASGGELSRVMLALEVCLAGNLPVPTMVFDEVDAGVGGKAAVEVGRRLARLAHSAQVIVVTHLPQVAAFADHHYAVERSDDGRVTTSGVAVLDDDQRLRELSRMLAGLQGSDAALAHADELVELARSERAS